MHYHFVKLIHRKTIMSKLTYGINRKTGSLVFIGDVERGDKCDCICPNCKAPLVAKKGKIKEHHFAHRSEIECKGACESALHLLAKEILEERKILRLPILGHAVVFDKVLLEKKDHETGLVPDCVGIVGNTEIWIEFFKTHAVDDGKTQEIRKTSRLCIEINLNDVELDKEEVQSFLESKIEGRKWVNPTDNSLYKYALTEDESLVDINSDILHKHLHFYCISCKQEVYPVLVNGKPLFFFHKTYNSNCKANDYLVDLGIYAIKKQLQSRPTLMVKTIIDEECKSRHKCPYKNEDCVKHSIQVVDAYEDGYSKRTIETYKDNCFYGVVLKSDNPQKPNILIGIVREEKEESFMRFNHFDSNNHDVIIDDDSQNTVILSNDLFLNEDYLMDVISQRNLLQKDMLQGALFCIKIPHSVQKDRKCFNRNFYRFSLYETGETSVVKVFCNDIKRGQLSRNSILDIYLYKNRDYNFSAVKRIGLNYCLKHNYITDYCEICKNVVWQKGCVAPPQMSTNHMGTMVCKNFERYEACLLEVFVDEDEPIIVVK